MTPLSLIVALASQMSPTCPGGIYVGPSTPLALTRPMMSGAVWASQTHLLWIDDLMASDSRVVRWRPEEPKQALPSIRLAHRRAMGLWSTQLGDDRVVVANHEISPASLGVYRVGPDGTPRWKISLDPRVAHISQMAVVASKDVVSLFWITGGPDASRFVRVDLRAEDGGLVKGPILLVDTKAERPRLIGATQNDRGIVLVWSQANPDHDHQRQIVAARLKRDRLSAPVVIVPDLRQGLNESAIVRHGNTSMVLMLSRGSHGSRVHAGLFSDDLGTVRAVEIASPTKRQLTSPQVVPWGRGFAVSWAEPVTPGRGFEAKIGFVDEEGQVSPIRSATHGKGGMVAGLVTSGSGAPWVAVTVSPGDQTRLSRLQCTPYHLSEDDPCEVRHVSHRMAEPGGSERWAVARHTDGRWFVVRAGDRSTLLRFDASGGRIKPDVPLPGVDVANHLQLSASQDELTLAWRDFGQQVMAARFDLVGAPRTPPTRLDLGRPLDVGGPWLDGSTGETKLMWAAAKPSRIEIRTLDASLKPTSKTSLPTTGVGPRRAAFVASAKRSPGIVVVDASKRIAKASLRSGALSQPRPLPDLGRHGPVRGLALGDGRWLLATGQRRYAGHLAGVGAILLDDTDRLQAVGPLLRAQTHPAFGAFAMSMVDGRPHISAVGADGLRSRAICLDRMSPPGRSQGVKEHQPALTDDALARRLALRDAAAVFVGTVRSAKLVDVEEPPYRRFIVEFDVQRVKKGARAKAPAKIEGDMDYNTYPFEVGRQYLVYAERRRGRLFVLRTSRTAPVAWVTKELQQLGLR